MLNLKKTAVAVLALSSSAAFAGTMGPVCSAVNVTVPCETTAWDFGGKAIYLQPSLGGSDLGTERTFTTTSGTTSTFGKNPNYAWGFFLEGSYHFNTGNDFNLNWYHLRKSSSRSFTNFTGGAATASANPQWDAVNMELGQHVDFGEAKSIRFHGGAQFARLAGNSSVSNAEVPVVNFTTTPATVVASSPLTATGNPTYNGFGPRVGADMAYDWGNGLSMYANGAGALLAGSAKFTSTLVGTTGATATSTGSQTLVVPELEGKLGLAYTYALAQGDLTLDAAWFWTNYFNVLDTEVTNIGQTSKGNFALQGPVFGLKWLGNIA